MDRFVTSSTISSNRSFSDASKMLTASFSSVSIDSSDSGDDDPCCWIRVSELDSVSMTVCIASGLSRSVLPTTPDRRPLSRISMDFVLSTLSPRTKSPTPSPKNSSAASASPRAKSSSSWLSLGATASVSCLMVVTTKDGDRTPSAPGSNTGSGSSSSFGLAGRMSPKKGMEGGRGGVRATIASWTPCRKICLVKISTIESTSGSSKLLRLSASSDMMNFRPSRKLIPSSGTASMSTKTAPSCVATDPAALFNRARSLDNFNPDVPSPSLLLLP
mmetsp:Transcript_10848/g.23123  ORF Transcript_10848/g.23123 Transcript_10848/m.23123 type:complete len:274 (+) Transcript_10848:131-952(+)